MVLRTGENGGEGEEYDWVWEEEILTMNFSSILPRRSKPGASSRWWLAFVSAMVETMAM